MSERTGLVRRGERILLIAAVLLFIASQAHIIAILGPQAEDILRFQTTFSPAAFWQIVGDWGSEGSARYIAHFPDDTLHALIYGTLGVVIATCTPLFKHTAPLVRRLAVAALPTAALCDLIENYGHETLLRTGASAHSGLVALAAGFASIKWLIVAVFVSAVVIAALRRFRR